MANLLPIVAFWFCHLPSFSHCQVKIPFFFSHPTLYCHVDLTSSFILMVNTCFALHCYVQCFVGGKNRYSGLGINVDIHPTATIFIDYI